MHARRSQPDAACIMGSAPAEKCDQLPENSYQNQVIAGLMGECNAVDRSAVAGDRAAGRLCSRPGRNMLSCCAPPPGQPQPGQPASNIIRAGRDCFHQRWAGVGECHTGSRYAAAQHNTLAPAMLLKCIGALAGT